MSAILLKLTAIITFTKNALCDTNDTKLVRRSR